MKKIVSLFAIMVLAMSAASAAPIEVVVTSATTQYYSEGNDFYMVLDNDVYSFRFDIICAEGETDIHDGQTYTLSNMDTSYSYAINQAASAYIYYNSVELVRNNGYYDINVTDTDGQTYHVVYAASGSITEPVDTVYITIDNKKFCRLIDLVSTQNMFQLIGADATEEWKLYFACKDVTSLAGTYTYEKVYTDYTYLYHYDLNNPEAAPQQIVFNNLLPNAVVNGDASACTATINYVGLDRVLYVVNFSYNTPVESETKNINGEVVVTKNQYYDLYKQYYGYGAYDIKLVGEDYTLAGSIYNENDTTSFGTFDKGSSSLAIYDAEGNWAYDIFSGSITIAENDGGATLTGSVVCYGDVKFTFNDPEAAIKNVNADADAAISRKVIRNGQLIIRKDNKTYNVSGTVVE